MRGLYIDFLIHFCKVDFVCANAEPNWLGWVFIAIACWLALVIIAAVSLAFMR